MTHTRTIRLLIADDHEMVRRGLALFIQSRPELQLVGEAANGHQAVELCRQLQPDVVLMDLMMPEMDGISAMRQIHTELPRIRLIALSSFADETLVTSSLSAGATAYLLKNASVDTLVNAIHDAFNNKATLAPEAAQSLVNAAQRPPILRHPLSQREQQVLTLMTQGLSNKEIAETLIIGVSTVKKYVSSIFTKLDTTSRAEAAALAVRHHLTSE